MPIINVFVDTYDCIIIMSRFEIAEEFRFIYLF